jgi:hypothetical protein
LLRQAQVDSVTAAAVIGHMQQHYSTVRPADIPAAGDAAAARVATKLTLILGGAAPKESSAADGSETAGEASTSNRP